MGRKVDICTACGEEKEIVAHGLCHKCNMAARRNQSEAFHSKADKFATAQRKAQEKMDANLIKMMKMCNEFETGGLMLEGDVDAIREIIRPYVNDIGKSLASKETQMIEEALKEVGPPQKLEEEEASAAPPAAQAPATVASQEPPVKPIWEVRAQQAAAAAVGQDRRPQQASAEEPNQRTANTGRS